MIFTHKGVKVEHGYQKRIEEPTVVGVVVVKLEETYQYSAPQEKWTKADDIPQCQWTEDGCHSAAEDVNDETEDSDGFIGNAGGRSRASAPRILIICLPVLRVTEVVDGPGQKSKKH